MKKQTLLILCILGSYNTFAENNCIEELNLKKCFFNNGTSVSSIEKYKEEKLVSYQSFSLEGKEVGRIIYEHLKNNSYYKTSYLFDFINPVSKVLAKKNHDEEEVILKKYGYDKKTHALESVDTLENDLIKSRYIYNDEGEDFTYLFKYDEHRIIGYDVIDKEGIIIGDYNQNSVGNIPGGPSDAVVKIAIIDSGFDHEHKDLRDHILINSEETFNGKDNDNDGFIDNYIGVHYDGDHNLVFSNPFQGRFFEGNFSTTTPGVYGIPFETISVESTTGKINSHGTHVSSIALEGLESASLLAFAGDFGEAKYLDLISKKLKASEIDFVNMSFSFPHYRTGDVPMKTYKALENLFKENPEVVFFVASGNDGMELISGQSCLYPACYDYKNVITIGATEDSKWRDDNNYEMAEYSNFGERFVDFFAPGTKVKAALIGDMSIRYSGTSMASPMALNLAAKIKESSPNLTALEVIEIMKEQAIVKERIKSKYGVINSKLF